MATQNSFVPDHSCRDSLPGGGMPKSAAVYWGNTLYRTFDRSTNARGHHLTGAGLHVNSPIPSRPETPDPTLMPRPQRTLPTKYVRDCQVESLPPPPPFYFHPSFSCVLSHCVREWHPHVICTYNRLTSTAMTESPGERQYEALG